MIVVDKNKVQLEGTLPELLTDLTLVAKQVREIATKALDEKGADEFLEKAFNMAKMTPEELENKRFETMCKIMELLMGRGEKNE